MTKRTALLTLYAGFGLALAAGAGAVAFLAATVLCAIAVGARIADVPVPVGR